MFRELCSDITLKNIVLVTNMWSTVSRDVGEAREKELSSRFFEPARSRMARHHDTIQSAHDIIGEIIRNHSVASPIQQEPVGEQGGSIDTAVGEGISRDLNEQIRHRGESKRVEEDAIRASKEKDEETREGLEEGMRRLQEWMGKIKKDLEGVAANCAAGKERMEARVIEMEREARQRAEAELANLNRRLQEVLDASAADRARLEQEEKNKERAEVKRNKQLADVDRRLQNAIDVSATDRARLEQEAKEERERARVELVNLNHRLQDVASASAAERARLEQEVKERELAKAEHNRQLIDLTHCLQDETNASATYRTRLEEEIKKLRERVNTTYVRVSFSLVTHDD